MFYRLKPGRELMAANQLVQKRKQYSQDLEESLEKILRCLAEMHEVQKVILFGSYATGRRDLFTDLDLIVVMETDKDLIHRTADLYQKLQVSVDLDLLVYTPDEFEIKRKSAFLRQALDTGQVIYEKKLS
jgi:predicted nucleotidyltransferase